MISPKNLNRLRDDSLLLAITNILYKIKKDRRLDGVQIIELIKSELKHQDSLSGAINLLLDELCEEYSASRLEIVEEIAEILRKKFRIARSKIYKKDFSNIQIPVGIFIKNVGSLESLVRYLHEKENLSFTDISKVLKRANTTIKTSYKESTKKGPKILEIYDSEIKIPLKVFSTDKLTVFESSSLFLKKSGLSYSEIGRILNKDQRNVWSTISHALTKLKKEVKDE